MPSEPMLPKAPFSGGAFQGNFAQTQDLYTWQRAETADNPYSQALYDPYSSQQNFESTTQSGGHGQGQYLEPFSRLTQAEQDAIQQGRDRFDAGFDY